VTPALYETQINLKNNQNAYISQVLKAKFAAVYLASLFRI
jgi:hypothetical protein